MYIYIDINSCTGQFGISTSGSATANPVLVAPQFPSIAFTSMSPGDNHALFVQSGVTCFAIFSEDPLICTSHGACVSQDTCICRNGYTGPDCSIPICYGLNATDPLVCSGNGSCMAMDTCICYSGYSGPQCTVYNTGYLYASGNDHYNQLANNNWNNQIAEYIPVVANQLAGIPIRSIATGNGFSLILAANGTLYGVGLNSNGQLGDGTVNTAYAPVRSAGTLTSRAITGMCVGTAHSLAVDSLGKVWAWGDNSAGQIGNGVVSSYIATPYQIGDILGTQFAVSVSCGAYHSGAMTNNGSVFVWGSNTYGQTGDGSKVAKYLPVQIWIKGFLYKKRVGALALGSYHTSALVADGIVWSWGYNVFGTLGNAASGTNVDQQLAVTTVGAINNKNLTALTAAAMTVYAVASDGTAWAWGFSQYGQIPGTTATQATPIQVLSNLKVKLIVGGTGDAGLTSIQYHCFAITSDELLYVWGSNNWGQFGLGYSSAATSTPVRYNLNYPNRTVAAAASGFTHNLVLYKGFRAMVY
jgi:alpha-tubulin suppressor-like RCC1 family protein